MHLVSNERARSTHMDTGYVTVIAALGGAALGGFTSFATSWTTLRAQLKERGNASSKSRRRKLYKSFIMRSSEVYGDALIHDNPEFSGLVELHALVSLMRVNSSAQVVETAVKVVRLITETYNQPNRSPAEIELMIQNGSIDLLDAFSEALSQRA